MLIKLNRSITFIFLCLSLILIHPSYFTQPPLAFYLSPAFVERDPELAQELCLADNLVVLLKGNADTPSTVLRIKTDQGHKELRVDKNIICHAYQKSKQKHFPFILAVLGIPGNLDPKLLYFTAKNLLEESEYDKEKQEQYYFYARYFLGAAIHFAQGLENEKIFSDVVDLIRRYENTNFIPVDFSDLDAFEKKKEARYHPAEYADVLDHAMFAIVDLAETHGNLTRWNERFSSLLPSKLQDLKKAKESTERKTALAEIKKEFETLNAQFEKVPRDKSKSSFENPTTSKTTLFPKKGEKISIALQEKYNSKEKFINFLEELLVEKVCQSLNEALKKVSKDEKNILEVLTQINWKQKDKVQKILAIESSLDEERKTLTLTREALDEIGKALLFIQKSAVLKNFGGKGTRFALRNYIRDPKSNMIIRNPYVQAKSGFVVLGDKKIMFNEWQAHQNFEQELVRSYLGEEIDFSSISHLILESHITHEEQRGILTKEIKLHLLEAWKDHRLLPDIIDRKSFDRALYSDTKKGSEAISKLDVVTNPARPLYQAKTGRPIAWRKNQEDTPDAFWPDSHNSAFVDLYTSGAARDLVKNGVQYLFVSNGDNLVALPYPGKVALLELSGKILMNDVAEKPPGEKGGSLIQFKEGAPEKVKRSTETDNQLMLIEGFEMPSKLMEVVEEMEKAVISDPLEIAAGENFFKFAEGKLGTQRLSEELALLLRDTLGNKIPGSEAKLRGWEDFTKEKKMECLESLILPLEKQEKFKNYKTLFQKLLMLDQITPQMGEPQLKTYLDELIRIERLKRTLELYTNNDFLEVAETLLGTKNLYKKNQDILEKISPEFYKLEEKMGEDKKLAREQIQILQSRFFSDKRISSKPGMTPLLGENEEKFKLFNTANYLFNIQRLLEETFSISWNAYEKALQKAEEGDPLDLMILRRKIKARFPVLFEADKTYEMTGDKRFKGEVIQINQLAGQITQIVPNNETIYLEVPAGPSAQEECQFQPLKSNVETARKNVGFLQVLLEDNDGKIPLIQCRCPQLRAEDPYFLKEYDEWIGVDDETKKKCKHGVQFTGPHKDFEDYRSLTLSEAISKAENDLSKLETELDVIQKVLRQYRDTPLKRISERIQKTAVILMAGGEQTRMKEDLRPKIFASFDEKPTGRDGLTTMTSQFDTLLDRIVTTLKLVGLEGKRNPYYLVLNEKQIETYQETLFNKPGTSFSHAILESVSRLKGIEINQIKAKPTFMESLAEAVRKAKENNKEYILVLLGDLLPDATWLGKILYQAGKPYSVVLAKGRGGHSVLNQNKIFPLGFKENARNGTSLMALYFPVSLFDPSRKIEDLSKLFPKENTDFYESDSPVFHFNTPEQLQEIRRIFSFNPRRLGLMSKEIIPPALASYALQEVDPSVAQDPKLISSGLRKSVFASKPRADGEKSDYIVEIFTSYQDGDRRYRSALKYYDVYGYNSGRVLFHDDQLRIIVRENLNPYYDRSLDKAITTIKNEKNLTELMEQAARYVRRLQRKKSFTDLFPHPREVKDKENPLEDKKYLFDKESKSIVYPFDYPSSDYLFHEMEKARMEMVRAFRLVGFNIPEELNKAPTFPYNELYWSHGTLSPSNMFYNWENGKPRIVSVTGGDFMMIAPAERDLAGFIARMIDSLKTGDRRAQNFEKLNNLAAMFLHEYYKDSKKDPQYRESLHRLLYFLEFDLLFRAWTIFFERDAKNLVDKSNEAGFYLRLIEELNQPNKLEKMFETTYRLFDLKGPFDDLVYKTVRTKELAPQFGVTKVNLSPSAEKVNKIQTAPFLRLHLHVYVPGARDDAERRKDVNLQKNIRRRIFATLEIKKNPEDLEGEEIWFTPLETRGVNYIFWADMVLREPGTYYWRVHVNYEGSPHILYPRDDQSWHRIEVLPPLQKKSVLSPVPHPAEVALLSARSFCQKPSPLILGTNAHEKEKWEQAWVEESKTNRELFEEVLRRITAVKKNQDLDKILWDLWDDGKGILGRALPILILLPRVGGKDEIEHVLDTLRAAKFLWENDYTGFMDYRKSYKARHPEDNRQPHPLSQESFTELHRFVSKLQDTFQVDVPHFIYGFLLLHDIGKAVRLPEHDLIGVSLLPPVLKALGCNSQETLKISWLTQYHLLLSRVSMAITHPAILKEGLEEWKDPLEQRKMLLWLTLVQWSDAAGTFGGVYMSDKIVKGYMAVAQTKNYDTLIQHFPSRRVLGWTQTPSLMQEFQPEKAKAVWDTLFLMLSDKDFFKVSQFISSRVQFSYEWDNFSVIEESENMAKLIILLAWFYYVEEEKGNSIKNIGFSSRMTPRRSSAFKQFLSRFDFNSLTFDSFRALPQGGNDYSRLGIPIEVHEGRILVDCIKLDEMFGSFPPFIPKSHYLDISI